MALRQLPPEWQNLATRKGIPASARGIANAAGVATTTITRMVFDQVTSPSTVRQVAAALGITTDEVYRLVGIDQGDLGPYDPPEDAHRLTARQRQALDVLIRAMIEQGDDTGGG